MFQGCFCTNILYCWLVTLNIWQTTLMHDSTQLVYLVYFFKEKNYSLFLTLGILSTMLSNYSAWWCHHWEQHMDMKSVALSRLTNGPLFTVREMIKGRGWLCSASSGNAHIGDSEFSASCIIYKWLEKCFKY